MQKCSCGVGIEFVKVEGRPVPCDPAAAVYSVMSTPQGELLGTRVSAEPGMLAPAFWVNHFKTCPAAGHYTRHKSEREQQITRLLEAVDAVLDNPDEPTIRGFARLRGCRLALE